MAENQTATSQFSSAIFAFMALDAKTTNGLQVLKDIADYLRRRSQLEAEYAKKLSDLYKEKPGAGFFTSVPAITKEQTALRTLLLGVEEKGLKVAEKHAEFANKIISDVCNPLDNFFKTKDPERKKISIEGQKYLRTVGEAKAVSARAKAAFDAAMKEAEVAQEQLEKAEKDEINQPDNKKLKPITQKASANFLQKKDKAKSLDTAYRETIKKANDELEKFVKESMPGVLNQLQKWEEERWNTLVNYTRTLTTLQEGVPTALNDYTTELKTLLSNTKVEADIKESLEAVAKEAKEEKPVEYAPYTGKFQLEEKKEEKQEEQKQEEPKKEESVGFGGLTAEEKLEQEKKKAEEDKSKLEAEEKKKAEAKKKADELKANLFAANDDLFKD